MNYSESKIPRIRTLNSWNKRKINDVPVLTVKILKFGTPQTIAIIVLKNRNV